jgi:hypothetical protein
VAQPERAVTWPSYGLARSLLAGYIEWHAISTRLTASAIVRELIATLFQGGELARRSHGKGTFDRARDELFSHIHRCEVIGAEEEQQAEWMDDTIQYMAERYPDLDEGELRQLRELGLRFCQPVIPLGGEETTDSQKEADAA